MGETSHSGKEPSRGGRFKRYAILVLVLYFMEYSVELIGDHFGKNGFRERLASFSQNLETELQQLDPFSVTRDFFSRLGDRHSVWAWNWSAPFNQPVHDDRILKQLIALNAIAPRPPRVNLLSPVSASTSQADDYQREFTAWESQYREIAHHLVEFNASQYDDCMRRARNSSGILFAECDYVLEYSLSTRSSRIGGTLGSDLLGLPDAFIYSVGRAFRGGVFAKVLGFSFVLTTVLMLGRWKLPAIFLAPLAVSLCAWFLLLLAQGADALLGHVFLAPAIPTVASAVGLQVHGLFRTAFGVAQHNAAHKLTEHIAKA